MKLPRWLVILFLSSSLLAVLAAAGWWWVTWPERTAREFVELVKVGQWEAASTFIVGERTWVAQNKDDVQKACSLCPTYFEFPARTLTDFVSGRRLIRAGLYNQWTLVVTRGRISANEGQKDFEGLSKGLAF